MILSLDTTVTNLIARIQTGRSGVYIRFPEPHDEFIKLVKSLGYRWDGSAWYRRINQYSGPILDRAVESAASIMRSGFSIEIDDNLADMLKIGNWKPEQKRWLIKAGSNLGLLWRGQNDNLYRKALTLPGAHWDRDHKSVVVQPLYYQEIAGFADEHEFAVSDEAQEMLENAKREYTRNLLPDVPIPATDKPKRKSGTRLSCNPNKFTDIPPRSMQTLTQLLPHQIPAVEKLLPICVGAFFMDMGTGKTRCAIELVARRQQRVSKVIWFCPVSLRQTIAYEIQKHTAGESVYVFDDKTDDQNLPDAFWYIVGIESMSSSDRVVLTVNSMINSDTFAIVDESSYIKGHSSKRSMRIAELCRNTRYRLLLTGTPISQGIEDLYAQMRFLSPDILGYGSFYSFARNHLEYSDKYPGMIVRAHKTEQIVSKLSPYIYQVTKSECFDLPDKLYDGIYFDLSDEQRDAYERAKCDILLDVDYDDIKSYTIFKLFTALQQIVSGFHNVDGDTIRFPHRRLTALETAVSSIPEDERVIIWCKYVDSVLQISELLPDCAVYYGDINPNERDKQLEHFRSGKARFLVATQATAGHGLTLNECHYHIFYENEFKYSHRIQAEDRSHRIGQTKPVTYIDIVSRSGIDDKIQCALSRKKNVVRMFKDEIKKAKAVKI